MDYDQTDISASYDAGRSQSPRALKAWLDACSAAASGQRIEDLLDLGCGTGRFSAPLSKHFGARVIGVDPSEKMLAEARKKASGDVRFLLGTAESVPLPDASVDMVFMSMVLHHFADPRRAARECHRVLRSGGLVCLRGGAGDRIETYPHVRFFPGAITMLRSAIMGVNEVHTLFAESGFSTVSHEMVETEVASSWLEFAEKISHRADSFLARLPDAEFASGLHALQEYAGQTSHHGPVVESVDFFAFRRIT